MKPLVAIVGRPNVGKSMLFNKLIGQRLSIVEDTPGVTRDRIYGESEWCGRKFRLVDTGGIEPRTDDQILSFMREQAEIAIQHADVIIFLTDVKTGLTASDQEVANMLLRSHKPIVLAVNKMDSTGRVDPDFYEFYNGTVDLSELARETFILNMPSKTLCREDCRGLCSGCGVNLNYEKCRCKKEVDPRLAALAKLLEQ